LLKNEEFRRKMGEKGREKAKTRWQPDLVVSSTLNVYNQILEAENGITK